MALTPSASCCLFHRGGWAQGLPGNRKGHHAAGAAGSDLAGGRQCAAQPEAWRCPSPGVRGPVFGEPAAPPPASAASLGEGQGSEVDVSDLGSRNYSARTDFYCLVSEDDM